MKAHALKAFVRSTRNHTNNTFNGLPLQAAISSFRVVINVETYEATGEQQPRDVADAAVASVDDAVFLFLSFLDGFGSAPYLDVEGSNKKVYRRNNIQLKPTMQNLERIQINEDSTTIINTNVLHQETDRKESEGRTSSEDQERD